MKKYLAFILFLGISGFTAAQTKKAYKDSILLFQKNYADSHEVVKGSDKKYFHFFSPDEKFRVVANFIQLNDTAGFIMKTSGTRTSRYFKYGILNFEIDRKPYQLRVYRSQDLMATKEYKDYLFVPYTDLTSGEESYGGGKYLEFFIKDIINNTVVLDFNKAYNPYCAYASGYNCPIPPRENNLNVAIKAGEKQFGKSH